MDVNNGVENAGNAPAGDLAAELEKVRAEKARVEEERDNYKKGMLKAKGYLPNDGQDGDDTLSVEDVVKKVILEQRTQDLTQREQDINKKILDENKTLKETIVAIQNKSQLGGAGSGSGADKEPPLNNYWTTDQEASLKAKGLDPKKVWENYQKQLNAKK